MTTNRSLINNDILFKPTQLLAKGLPIPFLEGKYLVEQGWCSVITEGGAYKEILGAGTHFLGKYQMFRDLKATAVDLRVKTLTVSTTREFTIAQPVPVEINLDLQVEYRVADARRIVTEISTPLTSLFDRVIQAVRGSIVHATIDEIRTQGEGISRATLQRLQASQLPATIGLEVLNVLTTSIKATDAGSDALAGLQMDAFAKVQDWRVENSILQQAQITPQWLMINRPEIYAQMMAGNTEIIKELIDKGLMDPAGFLNQAGNAQIFDPAKNWSSSVLPGLPGNSGNQSMGGIGTPMLPLSSAPQLPTSSNDIHARIREEVNMLERNIPGIKIKSQPGTDDRGLPDGSYGLLIRIPRNSGGNLDIRIACLSSYPTTPPADFAVEVDGEATPFQSAILRRWSGQYLLEIVREVKQYFG